MAGYKFRRQAIIGPYIVDFVCFEARLVIEADGGQHVERALCDQRRTARLESSGFRVIRFWNNEILFDTRNVLREIHDQLINTPSPQPSPGGRGSKTKDTSRARKKCT
jgi:very-short-patch-repair endonuclease